MLTNFQFQPEKIQLDTVRHYLKSNMDGTQAIDLYVYRAAPDRIEVLKIEPEVVGQAFVTAEIDWQRFSPSRLDSFHLFPDGATRPQAKMHLVEGGYEVVLGPMTAFTPIDTFPLDNYNFDLNGLNTVFPHLIDPTGPIEIGLIEPNWAALQAERFEDGILRDCGIARFVYVGDEMYNNIACRKYRVEGLNAQEGWLWADAQSGHFVNFEHPYPDNPQWQSFKLALQSVQSMNRADWDAFCLAECARAAGEV